MAGNSFDAGRTVTSKIVAILMTFTQGGEHPLTEIAQLAGLSVSTAYRLTSELAQAQLLERTDDGTYRAGLPLRAIGTTNRWPPSIAERAPFVLEDLAAATTRRVRLGVFKETVVGYLEKLPGSQPASLFSPAATVPAHSTAMGQVLLAFAPPWVVENVIQEGLPSYTPHTVTSPAAFRQILAEIRRTRVAVTRYQHEIEMCGIAMPVFGIGGVVIAAIEVAGHDLDQEFEPILSALTIATRGMARELV